MFHTPRIPLRLFGFFLFLTGLQTALAQSPLNPSYTIIDTERNQEISLDQLSEQCNLADIIFFGEEHNDSIGHRLELALLQKLNEQYANVALSLEMFQSDVQLILDEYLAGLISESSFQRDARCWNNYADYQPMLEYAKEKQLPVLAANAPSRYTNRVTRNGLESLEALDKRAKSLLAPLPIDTLKGPYYEKFVQLMGGAEHMPGMHLYQSQTVWDATMAYRLSQFRKKNKAKILHITGRFHCDERLGIYAQLQRYAKRARLLNISCFPKEDTSSANPVHYRQLADIVILTHN